MTDETRALDGLTVVLGGIGDDIHVVALKILERTLHDAGATVLPLGVMTPPEEFVSAAREAGADAIWISSSNGHAEVWCRGLREALRAAELTNILLYIGGNLAVGQRDWDDVEKTFGDLGFDRVYPPGTDPDAAVEDLAGDAARRSIEAR
jgi:methylaspartate mutase sigma subunit